MIMTTWGGFVWNAARVWAVVLGLAVGAVGAAGVEPGTLGLGVAQLYSDEVPNKRGVLVTRRVDPGSAAAEAGMQVGDLIISVNGTPVAGRDGGEISRVELRGAAGGTVRLGVVKMGSNGPAEVTLTRKPFPPLRNPASDAFSYVIPGNWRLDPRYPFPLPWAPGMRLQGFEDVAFGPDFGDTASPDYHSYLFFWWLDGTTPLTAAQVQEDMQAYFRGLSADRGRRLKFEADLSKVSADYHDDAARASRTFGGAQARAFAGTVSLYDTHGKVITLHSEITTAVCAGSGGGAGAGAGHTVVYFAMSQQPRPAEFWGALDAVRDGFNCRR